MGVKIDIAYVLYEKCTRIALTNGTECDCVGFAGWTSKPAFMFYLDMLHDVLSLTNFLVSESSIHIYRLQKFMTGLATCSICCFPNS